MCDHQHHRALQCQRAARVDADQHIAHVRNGGVGDHSFDVGLNEGLHGAVHDAEHPEPHRDRGELLGGVGEQRQGESQHAVACGLQQQAGEVNRARGGGLRVGIGQPAVQGWDRQLDREGKEEAEHQRELEPRRQCHAAQVVVVEGENPGGVVIQEHQPEDRQQHQEARGLRVDEELCGRRDPRVAAGSAVSPQRDQEVHRDQHHFPEQEEEEEIDGKEHADHAGEDPQQVQVEEAGTARDLRPRAEDRQQSDEPRQYDQRERQTVQCQVDADTHGRNPGDLQFHLPLGGGEHVGREAVVAARPEVE